LQCVRSVLAMSQPVAHSHTATLLNDILDSITVRGMSYEEAVMKAFHTREIPSKLAERCGPVCVLAPKGAHFDWPWVDVRPATAKSLSESCRVVIKWTEEELHELRETPREEGRKRSLIAAGMATVPVARAKAAAVAVRLRRAGDEVDALVRDSLYNTVLRPCDM
jgi:hypothetical protein